MLINSIIGTVFSAFFLPWYQDGNVTTINVNATLVVIRFTHISVSNETYSAFVKYAIANIFTIDELKKWMKKGKIRDLLIEIFEYRWRNVFIKFTTKRYFNRWLHRGCLIFNLLQKNPQFKCQISRDAMKNENTQTDEPFPNLSGHVLPVWKLFVILWMIPWT